MPSSSDSQYDLFISYASKDDVAPEGEEKGWIRQFVERLKEEHLAFTGDATWELNVFLDRKEIHAMHNWQHKLLESCQNSRLFLAFISPNYFASEWCRREWNTWIDAEIGKHILSGGAATVYIVDIPWLYKDFSEQDIAAALDALFDSETRATHPDTLPADCLELAGQISARQQTNVKLFYDEGIAALRQADMQKTLQELSASLNEQAQRIRDAEGSFSSVPAYNKHFTGRLSELTQLRESLDDRKTGVITSIHGLGGIGKTELAFTYAHAFASIYPGGRYLIECEGHDDLRQPIMNSLGSYFGAQLSEAERMDPQRYFAGIIAHLRSHAHEKGRTLLLLDNVDQESLLAKEQTNQVTDSQGNLHLLATTRLGSFSIKNSDTTWLTLNSLPARDALALLYKFRPVDRDKDPQEHEAAKAIVVLLDGFTLAIELIAAYLGEEEESNFVDFLALLETDQDEVLTGLSGDQKAQSQRHNHEKHLGTILDFSLNRLTPVARTALQYAAHLPPDAIVIPWLYELCLKHHPKIEDKAQPGKPNLWTEALKQLHSLALLTPSEGVEADARIERLHRLVTRHLVGYESESRESKIEGEIYSQISKTILRLVIRRNQFLGSQSSWTENRWEIDPLESLAIFWDEKEHTEAGWLLNQVGQHWSVLQEWTRSERPMRRAIAIAEKDFGGNHPNVAIHLSNFANFLLATNQLGEAEMLLRRSLLIDETQLGMTHPNVAVRLNNLAIFLQRRNRFVEAEPLLRRAVLITDTSFGQNHPKVAEILRNLANLLKATDRIREAEPLLRRSLLIDEHKLGKNHFLVASDLRALASLLLELEQFEQTAFSMESSIFHEQTRSSEYLPVTGIVLNLSVIPQTANRVEEAEELLRRALFIDEKCFGENHPSIAQTLSFLATLLTQTNREEEAKHLLQRALVIYETSLGVYKQEIATLLNDLGQLLKNSNQFEKAEEVMRRALFMDMARLKDDDPLVAVRLNNLARLLVADNRLDEAEPLMRRAVIISLSFTKETGEEDPFLETFIVNYVDLISRIDLGKNGIDEELHSLGLEAGWDSGEWRDFLRRLSEQLTGQL